jgi:glycosyltransferase involved in cell wall biosynthesis
MIPISVYLVTFNEEQNLRRVLDSVPGCAEIIVVDSGSKDRTVEIAESYGAKVTHQSWLGMRDQKALALSLCTQPWVFNLDADEEVTPALWAEMQAFVARPTADALTTPFNEVFMGLPNHPWTRSNDKLRFARREVAYYGNADVHASLEVKGSRTRAQHSVYHYGEVSIEVKIAKLNRYSSEVAAEKAAKGTRFLLIRLLLNFPVFFFKSYVLRRNFMNGIPGFIGSFSNAFYAFMKEAKLYEIEAAQKREKAVQKGPGQ